MAPTRALRFAATLLALLAGAPVLAQTQQQPPPAGPPGGAVRPNPDLRMAGVPTDDVSEVMIKSTLMTFNDANLTGNYELMHARLHPVFAKQLSVEKLTSAFEVFRKMQINLAPILVHKPVYTDGPRLDDAGLLLASGYFDTRPWRTTFELAWSKDKEIWLLWKINVIVKPPGD